MSLRTAIESLPGRAVRGVFRTSDPMDINKTIGAVLLAGLLAMMTGIIAGILVPSEEAGHGAEAIVAEAPAGGGVEPAAATLEPILPLLAAADAQAGQTVAKKCTACHSFEKGGPAKVGPNLYDIVGAPRAAKEGFAYSQAIRDMGGDWTYEELNKFIAAPRAYIPGTKMSFGGIKNTKDRADLVAYLRTLADAPAPLSTDQEIEAAATAEPEAPAEGGQQTQEVASTEQTPATEETGQAASGEGGGGDLAALITAATPDQGKQVARKCLACHSFEAGGPNKVGPNLAGIVGADIASKDFAYSDALKGKEGTWTDESLDAFLAGPKSWAPGTKMVFAGLKKAEERAAVIAYLRSLSPNAPPLQ
ncbi:MAG TPA: cytochrome c family protein [Alphaproteobacteria bacterium]|nr:cytochrome c family protein [Alphaproteobacteria bacterium]